jgi:DNA-binding beta-propeller fold protein YncE
MALRCLALLTGLTLACSVSTAQRQQPMPPPIRSVTIPVPGEPFGIAQSTDGTWVFVALSNPSGVAVLKRHGEHDGTGLDLVRTISLDQPATGIVMTHDQQYLVVAAGSLVYFMNVSYAETGIGLPLVGSMSDGANAGSVYVNVTADDHWLFVADENLAQITVVDLAATRAGGFLQAAKVGQITVGTAPTAIIFSPDGKLIYSTIEIVPKGAGFPIVCPQEGPNPDPTPVNSQGVVAVIDVATAVTNPAHAVLAGVQAGCSPVRLALSPAGDRLYVVARNSNAVLAFDTSRMVSDPTHALLGSATVGQSPVPVAVANRGSLVLVGNSDRFEPAPTPQTLNLVDAHLLETGGNAVIGSLVTGAFPREMAVSPDGHVVYLSNYGSNTVQMLFVSSQAMSPLVH